MPIYKSNRPFASMTVSDADFFIGPKGELRWHSNNSPIPLDCCADYSIPHDPVAQKAAIDEHTKQFLAEYRAEREKNGYSQEELTEMRAAFGPGETVVDIATGKRIKL